MNDSYDANLLFGFGSRRYEIRVEHKLFDIPRMHQSALHPKVSKRYTPVVICTVLRVDATIEEVDMKITAIAAAMALFSAIVVGPAIAAGPAPVSIVSSHVDPEIIGTANNAAGQVSVSFVNNAAQPATRVSFALVSNGLRLASLHADGSFSQGVPIHKSFLTHAPQRDQTIILSSVTFADGTTWQNPSVPRGTFKAPPYNH